MTPEQYRQQCARQVMRDLRIAEDDAGHDERELSWQGWMLDNTWAFHEVAGVIVDVGSRREFKP